MAFKQPRVPEYRESEGTGKYIRSLVLFLKDFCNDVWTANNQRTGEIDAVKGGLSGIHYPVTSVCGKTGDVTLTAGDVGARPGSWMPTASDVGALAQGGTAADSSKLGGRTWDEHLLDIYPIGSIYMSVASTSPASLFGGTWERIAQGRMLLGMGAIEENHNSYWGTVTPAEVNPVYAGEMGGEAAHKLTVSEMPSHGHSALKEAPGWGESMTLSPWTPYFTNDAITDAGSSGKTDKFWTYSPLKGTGDGLAHNNMPPYLAVYMWKRVS